MAKVKSHFKIHTSISSHRNTAVLWSDVADRGMYAELGRLAMEKFAARTNDRFHLSSVDLMRITGAMNPGAANNKWRSLLSRWEVGAKSLGGHSPVTAKSVGGHWVVTFRNFAAKQGLSQILGTVSETHEDEDKDKDEDEDEKSSDSPSLPSWCDEIADDFVELIAEVQPGRKVKSEKWPKQLELMQRRDARDPVEMEETLNWVFGPVNQASEYRFEVFSVEAFRKKYDNIRAGISRSKRKSAGTKNELIAAAIAKSEANDGLRLGAGSGDKTKGVGDPFLRIASGPNSRGGD